jgi:hypothetical protein
MNQEERQERISDPVLAAAMAELRAEVPHDVDWDRLRRSITGSAEMTLARKRMARRVHLPKSLVPLAAAATIAFSLWMGPAWLESMRQTAEQQANLELSTEQMLEQALDAETDAEFEFLVSGGAHSDAYLAMAVDER